MDISMDKYKTAVLGKALKQVFRGEINVSDCVEIAKGEINGVFEQKSHKPEEDTDDGFMGDIIGKCPLCGENVVRTNFGYGCSGYRENGCRFAVSNVICSRVIPKSAVRGLIENGRTQKLNGFVSPRTKKTFSAALRLENGKSVFDFNT